MIINTETLEIESARQIRQATGIPLPRNPSAETLTQLDPPRAYVVETEPPQGDVVEPKGFEQTDGEWRQAWDVREFTAGEQADRLEQAKTQAHQRINDAYDAECDVLVAGYPQREVSTFGKQEREARAWAADNTAPTPFLDGLLLTRTITKTELVDRILDKADSLADPTGRLTGKRQTLEKQILEATTVAEAEEVTW